MSKKSYSDVLGLFIKHFSSIETSSKASCNTYSITPCGPEVNILIDLRSNIFVNISFTGEKIISVVVIRKAFFSKKTLLSFFKDQKHIDEFNEFILEIMIEKIAAEVESIIKKN